MNLADAQNDVITQWTTKLLKQDLPASIRGAGIKASKGGKSFSLGKHFGKERSTGGINRVGITMRKHAVYREKGVGRGRGIGSGKTIGPPWFNPTVDRELEQLADGVAQVTGDVIAGNLRIR